MRTITDRHGVTWTVSERPAPAVGARVTDDPPPNLPGTVLLSFRASDGREETTVRSFPRGAAAASFADDLVAILEAELYWQR